MADSGQSPVSPGAGLSSSMAPAKLAAQTSTAPPAPDDQSYDDDGDVDMWNGGGEFRVLEADPDIDSTLGDDSDSFTTSLNSLVTHYKFENGRRYHAYHDKKYALPNDDAEVQRLELQHRIWHLCLSGRLHLAPLPKEIGSALDLGCGTGAWAIDFAELHPECHVIGTDLSPIQPTMVPPNVEFLIDDFTNPWLYPSRFNYIHSRMITIAHLNWAKLIDECWRNLEPGGWVEFQEYSGTFRCDDGTFSRAPDLQKWDGAMQEACEKIGIDLTAVMRVDQLFQDRGFVNIQSAHTKWALGTWPKGAREKEIGRLFARNIISGAEGLSTRLLTKVLGWPIEKVNAAVNAAENDIKAGKAHCYFGIEFKWAQKPFDAHD
ncbi:secondary metabolism regulator lae1 [Acrodontium crateriforme]|uniref:Secondary metabolism regulator lae1 n=1 Tax=Acrodontium crateriforme TaxID=150365 RepID=A0AAQ3M3D2_9PEZI|nr:secondary metabolism regulator lae1 [Acrodontium crateriforme]